MLYQNLIILVLVFCFPPTIFAENLECSQFSNCEGCAGQIDNSMKCRWCFDGNGTCVPSMYMCDPKYSVVHRVNCPLNIQEASSGFNETLNREVILYYIHAANRVASTSPVGAPMSCLLNLRDNFTLIREVEVNETMDSWSLGYIILVNHDLKHIVAGFRSTNHWRQLLMQYFVFMLNWLEPFPLGGKIVGYYLNSYNTILNSGFDVFINQVATKYPNYDFISCGHSLGGSLATVFSLHLARMYPDRNVDLYSWSGPRAGDETFVELLNQHVRKHYRVVRDGDLIPDMPLRVSEILPQAIHNGIEIFYPSHMAIGSYKVCDQAESQFCMKGSWWKSPFAHIYIFDGDFMNYNLDYCDYPK
ncbi:unnamed protein product [Caenorhabditis angaria]|uniref:Fungal lipase-type domain-containing protein n=1 Tax=Caenorhabditis angaria TaxID=860376 RepID=A0A9P1N9E7_9PELO|nr:unnamed protein product [Caenorhabditis angaria]